MGTASSVEVSLPEGEDAIMAAAAIASTGSKVPSSTEERRREMLRAAGATAMGVSSSSSSSDDSSSAATPRPSSPPPPLQGGSGSASTAASPKSKSWDCSVLSALDGLCGSGRGGAGPGGAREDDEAGPPPLCVLCRPALGCGYGYGGCGGWERQEFEEPASKTTAATDAAAAALEEEEGDALGCPSAEFGAMHNRGEEEDRPSLASLSPPCSAGLGGLRRDEAPIAAADREPSVPRGIVPAARSDCPSSGMKSFVTAAGSWSDLQRLRSSASSVAGGEARRALALRLRQNELRWIGARLAEARAECPGSWKVRQAEEELAALRWEGGVLRRRIAEARGGEFELAPAAATAATGQASMPCALMEARGADAQAALARRLAASMDEGMTNKVRCALARVDALLSRSDVGASASATHVSCTSGGPLSSLSASSGSARTPLHRNERPISTSTGSDFDDDAESFVTASGQRASFGAVLALMPPNDTEAGATKAEVVGVTNQEEDDDASFRTSKSGHSSSRSLPVRGILRNRTRSSTGDSLSLATHESFRSALSVHAYNENGNECRASMEHDCGASFKSARSATSRTSRGSNSSGRRRRRRAGSTSDSSIATHESFRSHHSQHTHQVGELRGAAHFCTHNEDEKKEDDGCGASFRSARSASSRSSFGGSTRRRRRAGQGASDPSVMALETSRSSQPVRREEERSGANSSFVSDGASNSEAFHSCYASSAIQREEDNEEEASFKSVRSAFSRARRRRLDSCDSSIATHESFRSARSTRSAGQVHIVLDGEEDAAAGSRSDWTSGDSTFHSCNDDWTGRSPAGAAEADADPRSDDVASFKSALSSGSRGSKKSGRRRRAGTSSESSVPQASERDDAASLSFHSVRTSDDSAFYDGCDDDAATFRSAGAKSEASSFQSAVSSHSRGAGGSKRGRRQMMAGGCGSSSPADDVCSSVATLETFRSAAASSSFRSARSTRSSGLPSDFHSCASSSFRDADAASFQSALQDITKADNAVRSDASSSLDAASFKSVLRAAHVAAKATRAANLDDDQASLASFATGAASLKPSSVASFSRQSSRRRSSSSEEEVAARARSALRGSCAGFRASFRRSSSASVGPSSRPSSSSSGPKRTHSTPSIEVRAGHADEPATAAVAAAPTGGGVGTLPTSVPSPTPSVAETSLSEAVAPLAPAPPVVAIATEALSCRSGEEGEGEEKLPISEELRKVRGLLVGAMADDRTDRAAAGGG